MEEWLFKYIDEFDENFPIYTMMEKEEEEIIDIIKECLESGLPYEVEEEEIY